MNMSVPKHRLLLWFGGALAAFLIAAGLALYDCNFGGKLAAAFGLILVLLLLAFRRALGELDQRAHNETRLEQHNSGLQQELAARAEAERALREALEVLQRRNAELLKADLIRNEFLATLSHELRTPLNAIIGFSEILRDGVIGEVTPQQRAHLDDIFHAGSNLLELINDLLDLSRIEAGKFALAPEDCNLALLLDESLAPLRQMAEAKQLRLVSEINPSLGNMRADPRRLRQILGNLLSNAMKFTPAGGIVTLRAQRVARAALPLTPAQETTEYLELAVADTGPGIAPELRDRLFQPFAMLSTSFSRAHGGTGLGLALVQRLATLMGGAVAVDSTPGAGACFTVWLPWRSPSPSATLPPLPLAGEGASIPLALVVEDDDMAAELIRAQLAAEGIEVLRARSAEEGLQLAARRKPDLFTVDILLPGMDGWELLAHLKQDARLADVPVVIISIVADSGKGTSLGAAKVLQKPYSRQELEQALDVLDFARADGSPPVVLVVDDDPASVELFAAHLAHGNYPVLRAGGGAEGLALARAEHPDLIVLDLMMPEMSGFEVVECLKEDPATAVIPILIVTAKTITEEDRKALNGHVLRIMEKAEFNHGRFIGEVRRALRRRK